MTDAPAIPITLSEPEARAAALKLAEDNRLADENRRVRLRLREALDLIERQAKLIDQLQEKR
jgi:hypothetical protein